MIQLPVYETAPKYYHYYFDLTKKYDDLFAALKASCEEMVEILRVLPEDKYDYRYAEGKWTVKEVLMHIIEVERILSYRALSFSRGESAHLPGFDEDKYILFSNTEARTYPSLVSEFISLRTANLLMFMGFSEEMYTRSGHANEVENNALNVGWFLVGHALHHLKVIQERYL